MQYFRSLNWPYTLACFAVAASVASFSHQYLEFDYLSSSVVGLFGWMGFVFATLIDNDETQGKT